MYSLQRETIARKTSWMIWVHRRSQGGAVGAPAPPGRKKRHNLQDTFVCAPPDRATVNFGDIFAGWKRCAGSEWFI